MTTKKKTDTTNLFLIDQDIKDTRKIGLYVSPNQLMSEVNKIREYLMQFGTVVMCDIHHLPNDLCCLVLPSISNIISMGGNVDADFINFINKYFMNINKEFKYPVVGFNSSCLTLWDLIGGSICTVTGHYKAGNNTRTLHPVNITNVPKILNFFPTLANIKEDEAKVYVKTTHLHAIQLGKLSDSPFINIIANFEGVPEAFVQFEEEYAVACATKTNSKELVYSYIKYVGIQTEPWLKVNYGNSFDYKYGGLSIGDHLSNSILFHLITKK